MFALIVGAILVVNLASCLLQVAEWVLDVARYG